MNKWWKASSTAPLEPSRAARKASADWVFSVVAQLDPGVLRLHGHHTSLVHHIYLNHMIAFPVLELCCSWPRAMPLFCLQIDQLAPLVACRRLFGCEPRLRWQCMRKKSQQDPSLILRDTPHTSQMDAGSYPLIYALGTCLIPMERFQALRKNGLTLVWS